MIMFDFRSGFLASGPYRASSATALTMARMPARTAGGRSGQRETTAAKSASSGAESAKQRAK
jgi:hypothetical protein